MSDWVLTWTYITILTISSPLISESLQKQVELMKLEINKLKCEKLDLLKQNVVSFEF